MFDIITYLCTYIQYLEKNISILLNLIVRYLPLRQTAYDDSQSPEYQKLKTDKLPVIIKFEKQDYGFLLAYYKWKYNKPLKPVVRRNEREVPADISCPQCGAPHSFMYDSNGGKANTYVKSAHSASQAASTPRRLWFLLARTAEGSSSQKRSVNTSPCIPASAINAGIISPILASCQRACR